MGKNENSNRYITIEMDKNNQATVFSELKDTELYNAFVALTCHIASKLKDKDQITMLADMAAKDAVRILNEKSKVIQKDENIIPDNITPFHKEDR